MKEHLRAARDWAGLFARLLGATLVLLPVILLDEKLLGWRRARRARRGK